MEQYYKKIKVLNETIWDNCVKRTVVDDWLGNFENEKEHEHALYMLSQFMYFNGKLIREMLKSMYRDLFKYRIVEKIREDGGRELSFEEIERLYQIKLKKTRFLGVGNPSESGVHLLYFFRQENRLPKNSFINAYQIFNRVNSGKRVMREVDVDHYVFIDDYCGSGSQAKQYSKDIVEEIKENNRSVMVDYLSLFSTINGRNAVKGGTEFDYVDSVFELDNSFKCFSDESRYFIDKPSTIDKKYAEAFCRKYGEGIIREMYSKYALEDDDLEYLVSRDALGFDDGQQLIGFYHNTPDNTFPIFWCDEKDVSWRPVFKRYHKI